jgi:hypothetical protein
MNKIYIDSEKLKKLDEKSILRMDKVNIVLENVL